MTDLHPPSRVDIRAIAIGLMLPLLLWGGAVIMITMSGYPGVVCMTPVAWLLALPVGIRTVRESTSPLWRAVAEAGAAGGLLGLWQGVMIAVAMSVSPLVGISYSEELPSPWFVAILACLVCIPPTSFLAALVGLIMRTKQQ